MTAATVVAVIAVASTLSAIAVVSWRLWGSGRPAEPQRYYSTDDGQTYFADAASKQPPFTHGGKPAVVAVVYRPAAGGSAFVGYLQTFIGGGGPRSPDSARRPGVGPVRLEAGDAGLRVKRPRDPVALWVGPTDPAFAGVLAVTAPDGSSVVQVEPE